MVRDSLIWNEAKVRKFYNVIFDCFEEQPHYVGIAFLNTRKKYYPEFAQPYVVTSEFIERVFLRDIGSPIGEGEFLRKLKRLDHVEGAFTTKLKYGNLPYYPPEKLNEMPEEAINYFKEHNLREEFYRLDNNVYVKSLYIDIPKETMSIYVSLNLHDAMKGVDDFIGEALRVKNQLLNSVMNGEDPSSHLRWFARSNVHIYSATHKRTAIKRYFVLDIDSLDRAFAGRVLDLFTQRTGVEPVIVIQTHGGFHAIYDRTITPDTEYARSLGKKGGNLITIARKLFIEDWAETKKTLGANGDDVVEIKVRVPMSPVPGTYQGAVKVKIIDL